MDFEPFLQFLETPSARVVLLLTGVAIFCVLAGYSIGKIRQMFRDSGPGASDMISSFRELHARGALSDEEYRNIKSKLGKQLRDQIKAQAESQVPVEVEFEDAGDDA